MALHDAHVFNESGMRSIYNCLVLLGTFNPPYLHYQFLVSAAVIRHFAFALHPIP
jgi:hypothetical protein